MLLDPDLLRSKADAFDSGLRGYLKHDVAAYLGRIALAVEVLGEDTGPPPALPADFQPDAIRTHEFDVVWRGLDREEVRAFLTQLADELESRLSSTDTSSTGTPAAGLSMSDRMREASGDLAPPTADTVRIEAPTAGPVVPKIDVPTIDAGLPTGEVPSISTPSLDVPSIDVPSIDIPDFVAPSIDVPDFVAPGIEVPTIAIPSSDLPTIDAPSLGAPSIDAGLPTGEVPPITIDVPNLDPPSIDVPDTAALTIDVPSEATDTGEAEPVTGEVTPITVPSLNDDNIENAEIVDDGAAAELAAAEQAAAERSRRRALDRLTVQRQRFQCRWRSDRRHSPPGA